MPPLEGLAAQPPRFLPLGSAVPTSMSNAYEMCGQLTSVRRGSSGEMPLPDPGSEITEWMPPVNVLWRSPVARAGVSVLGPSCSVRLGCPAEGFGVCDTAKRGGEAPLLESALSRNAPLPGARYRVQDTGNFCGVEGAGKEVCGEVG